MPYCKFHNLPYFPIFLLSFIKLLIHLIFSTRIGYHPDELYLIDCSKHLDFGYADLGPFVPWIIRISYFVMGENLFALRFFPALAGALCIMYTGLITKELGGSRVAQTLACLCVLLAPLILRASLVAVLPAYEPFFWTILVYLIIVIVKKSKPNLWIIVAFVMAIGFLNKVTILIFSFFLFFGILFSSHRKLLFNKQTLFAAIVFLALCLPFLIWQKQHDWIFFEFYQDVKNHLDAKSMEPVKFFLGQLFHMHTFNVVLAVFGIFYFAKSKQWIFLSCAAICMFLFFFFSGSKVYYIMPLYPFLISAGAILADHKIKYKKLLIAVVFIGLVVMIPVGLPLLSTTIYNRIAKEIEFARRPANMFKWMEGAERRKRLQGLGKIYNELSDREKKGTIILASHYSLAGAVNLLGRSYGLPSAKSGNVSYYYWGWGDFEPEIVIATGYDEKFLNQVFSEVQKTSLYKTYVCKNPLEPISKIWWVFQSFYNARFPRKYH